MRTIGTRLAGAALGVLVVGALLGAATGITTRQARTAAPGAVTRGATAAEGSSVSFSRADHVHSTIGFTAPGACTAGQYETGDNANAAPTCAQVQFSQLGGALPSHTHTGPDVTSAVANATNADTLDGLHASAFAAFDVNGDLNIPDGGIKLGDSIVSPGQSTPLLYVEGGNHANEPTSGSASGAVAYLGGYDDAYGLLIGVSGDGSAWLQAQRIDGAAATYVLKLNPRGAPVTIGGPNSGTDGHKLSLQGGTADHAFMSFYADAQATSTRSGWFGYGGSGTSTMTIQSEAGPLVLGAAGALQIWTPSGNAQVDASGNFTASGNVTAYSSISDLRLKTNVEPIAGALGKALSLRGVTHGWDDERLAAAGFNPTRGTVHGLIAQDVQRVMPDAVYEAKGQDGETYLGVRYERVVPLLVEAIRELEARVAKLEAER
jgi:hypothetical protein